MSFSDSPWQLQRLLHVWAVLELGFQELDWLIQVLLKEVRSPSGRISEQIKMGRLFQEKRWVWGKKKSEKGSWNCTEKEATTKKKLRFASGIAITLLLMPERNREKGSPLLAERGGKVREMLAFFSLVLRVFCYPIRCWIRMTGLPSQTKKIEGRDFLSFFLRNCTYM